MLLLLNIMMIHAHSLTHTDKKHVSAEGDV
jgi:hypothetical protein